MELNLVTITPEMASYYLAKNTANRKITEKNVTNIMQALVNNEWAVNGETIKFDVNGNLIDGQHRLTACIRSGIPFKSFLVNNLDAESFTTIDIGAKRTAADILSINEIQNSHNIAAIIKCYLESKIAKNYSSSSISASNVQILNEYNKSPDLWDGLALSYLSISKFVTTPFIAICKSAIDIYGDYWFEESINKIKTGQNLQYGDPCLTLREWCIINKGKVARQTLRAVYVKAIKAMANGNQIKVFRYTDTEQFPTLEK